MKTVLFVISMLSLSSAYAANQQVNCTDRSNSDLQLTVSVQGEQVLGASLYNMDWSQSAEATYSPAASVVKTSLGEEVTLANGQKVAIPYAAMRGYAADAVVNGSDEYSCN